MIKLIAFLLLALFATYMESIITFSKLGKIRVIPISNQLPS